MAERSSVEGQEGGCDTSGAGKLNPMKWPGSLHPRFPCIDSGLEQGLPSFPNMALRSPDISPLIRGH